MLCDKARSGTRGGRFATARHGQFCAKKAGETRSAGASAELLCDLRKGLPGAHARAGFPNPTNTTCWAAATLQSVFAMQSTVSVIEQHAANATCSARCVLCKLQETRRASERPLQRPDLEELRGLWLQEVGRDIRRQDDAGEFLHMLLRESPELRACFAQETCHHDTYAAQCGASGCHATANDTSEEEVLVDVHIPEEEPREADLSVVKGSLTRNFRSTGTK